MIGHCKANGLRSSPVRTQPSSPEQKSTAATGHDDFRPHQHTVPPAHLFFLYVLSSAILDAIKQIDCAYAAVTAATGFEELQPGEAAATHVKNGTNAAGALVSVPVVGWKRDRDRQAGVPLALLHCMREAVRSCRTRERVGGGEAVACTSAIISGR